MTRVASARASHCAASSWTAPALGAEPDGALRTGWSGAVTGYYYAMRDEPDFGVGVASLDRGRLHLEARYNYEARNATSIFAGWKFAGGDTVKFEVTPIVGGLFGAARARRARSGGECRLARSSTSTSRPNTCATSTSSERKLRLLVDRARLEAASSGCESVSSVSAREPSTPAATSSAASSAQLTIGQATFGVYCFNPDFGSRYVIVSLGAQF